MVEGKLNISMIVIIFFGLSQQACSLNKGMSAAEQKTIQSSAFGQPFIVHDNVDDVYSVMDALPASRPFHMSQISEAIEIPVRDCTTPGLYEMEKQMALNLAAADKTGATIPVKFSYSFGKKHDVIAKYANERAVLSQTNPGTSFIPVGGKKSSTHGGRNFYYEADNQEVARQYRTGERCFFSTIEINDFAGNLMSSGKYDFIQVTEDDIPPLADSLKSFNTIAKKLNYLKHMIHYMYYGYCKVGECAPDKAFAGEFSNRLFDQVPSLTENGDPQIIKLYIADLRSEQMEKDIVLLSEDTTRGVEIDSSINNILNICEIHKNYYEVTKNLSLAKEVNGYMFNPIQGAVQLLNNILSHDVDGTMLSSQYTPIVLDLNGDGIKTSSLRWGTYFNMANLTDANNTQEDLAHRTAWVGGDYVDYNQGSLHDPRVTLDVRIQAKDGFLVIPDDRGQVSSSAQMFGDNLQVGGQTYDNGFLALQAFAGKVCESDDVTERYVGPWDGDIYENQLKVWVDEDRDGLSDDGEIKSLREVGVVAINACNIVHADETDAFGNGTHLRSAILMEGPYSYLFDSHWEILSHLRYGHGLEGEKSYFHLAVDLIFQVDEDNKCSAGIPSSVVLDPPADDEIPENDPPSDEPPTDEPPIEEPDFDNF